MVIMVRKRQTQLYPLKINNTTLETYKNRDKNNRKNYWEKNSSPKVITTENSNVDESTNKELKLSLIYNDNQGSAGLPLDITVAPPSGKNDQTLKLLYRTDYNYLAGSTVFKNYQTINKEQEESKGSDSKQSIAENQLQQSNQDSTSQTKKKLEQNQDEEDNSWASYLKVKAQKTWTNFKYYCNPMNWFSYWKS